MISVKELYSSNNFRTLKLFKSVKVNPNPLGLVGGWNPPKVPMLFIPNIHSELITNTELDTITPSEEMNYFL